MTQNVMLWAVLFLPLIACHDVQEFTEDQFKIKIKETRHVVVFFFAPWCGHCKHLKPIYEEAAASIPISRKDITIAKLDCTVHEDVCHEFQITGYPTVKFFTDGKHTSDYKGSRDKESIVRFILSNSRSSVLIKTSGELQALLDSPEANAEPIVVALVDPSNVALSETLSAVTSQVIQYLTFAIAHDPAILGLSGEDTAIVLYRPKYLITKLEDPVVKFDGEYSVDGIKHWILKNGYGLVGYRTSSNEVFFPKETLLVFYHNISATSHLQGVNYHRNRLIKQIREAHINYPPMVYAYSFYGDFIGELNELGPDSTKKLPIVIIYFNQMKYVLDEYSHETFVTFLRQFIAGSLTAYIKSEPIPIEQNKAAIKVVAHTFNEIVNDNKKDVFIMFHAPWCGHCKKLMPTFEAIAEKLKDEPDVLLVTVDATANDIPHPYSVSGYPTLYFASKTNKDAPSHYEGERDEASLLKFIAKHSTDQLKNYDREAKPYKEEL